MAPVIEPSARSRRWRRAEYERLVELGVFAGERLELLDGVLVVREPQGSSHAAIVAHWHIEGEPAPIHARAGDFVLGPKNRWHHVEPVGVEPSIRVAINARGEFHRYDRPGCQPL